MLTLFVLSMTDWAWAQPDDFDEEYGAQPDQKNSADDKGDAEKGADAGDGAERGGDGSNQDDAPKTEGDDTKDATKADAAETDADADETDADVSPDPDEEDDEDDDDDEIEDEDEFLNGDNKKKKPKPVDEEDDDLPELEFNWQARIQSDFRMRPEEQSVGQWYDQRVFPRGVARNENLFGFRMEAGYGPVLARAEIDFVIYGFISDVESLADLSRREKADPFRFEAHRLYVKLRGLGLEGLDLTVGQQLILWGVGDQFNPTNNLNADDLEDILLFGEQQGNFMVRLDYWITPEWSMTGVLVPIFRPALLPRAGRLALASLDRIPFVDEALRLRTNAEQAAARELAGFPTVVDQVNVTLPEKSFENMQFSFRLGGTILEQDVSLSYYRGFSDFPQPFRNSTRQVNGQQCNPDDPNDCINGLIITDTDLGFPEMHVYGFNMSGEIGWLEEISDFFNAIGYRIEVALIVPQRFEIELVQSELNIAGFVLPAGEYDYDGDGQPGGPLRPAIVTDQPFAKWTLGLDYTFNKYVYANVQWVHGLADEFGAGDWITEGFAVRQATVVSDTAGTLNCSLQLNGSACVDEVLKPRIGDYLVIGIDVKFLNQRLLLRLFNIFDLAGITFTTHDPATGGRLREHFNMFTEEGFSAVIYPEVGYNFGYGLEFGAGALLQFGKPWTKFGDPAAGGHLLWTRARFSF